MYSSLRFQAAHRVFYYFLNYNLYKWYDFSCSQGYKGLQKNEERILMKTILIDCCFFYAFRKEVLYLCNVAGRKISCHFCKYGIIREEDINEITIIIIPGSILIYWRKEKTPQGNRKVADNRNTIKFHFGLAREELNEMHCL